MRRAWVVKAAHECSTQGNTNDPVTVGCTEPYRNVEHRGSSSLFKVVYTWNVYVKVSTLGRILGESCQWAKVENRGNAARESSKSTKWCDRDAETANRLLR